MKILLNSFVNHPIIRTMSRHNSPLPYRKKLPKHPSVSLDNKVDKVTSVSSHIAEPDSETGGQRSDLSKDRLNSQKSRIPSNSSRISNLGKSIVERENSDSNLNGKKQPNNGTKTVENSSPQIVQFNRKLEKESELVGMLGKQLYLAENQIQRMQLILSKTESRVKEKDQEIGRLKRKVRDWEVKVKNQEAIQKRELEEERKKVEDSERLYRRCQMLEHKIYEMEKFLADYGLVWVGDADGGPNSSSDKKSGCSHLKNCFTRLTANIEELNMTVGKGEVHVQRDKGGGGASFKTSPCMSLKFYKNGLVVQNGRIRSYDDPSTTSFIRDILDGYFPSELQEAYPNGVPFKVEDRRTETFQGCGTGFPGHGYRLGKIFPRRNQSHPVSVEQKQNIYAPRPSVPPSMTTNYAKSTTKSKSFSEAPPPLDMNLLRSKILASHNNNCSDSHIQSHINAELGLSPRIDKVKRESAVKDVECHISVREKTLKLKPDSRSGSQRFLASSGSRASSHQSSKEQISSGRLESTCSEDGRSRLRSSSLPGRKFGQRSPSRPRIFPGTSNCPISNPEGAKIPRVSRSAILERKTPAAPLLHQVNEPSSRSGELRLKVRSLNGSIVYLVHLCPDDTVGRLYRLLDNCLVKTRLRGYKVVISGYGSKRLEQLDASLREYGIVRDSVLHIVNDSVI